MKGVSSTIIRDMIIRNKDWKKLVPKEIAEYITNVKGVERIRGISKK